MGEGGAERPDDSQSPTGRWVSVNEAAEALGISVEAVRGRLKRGTLLHERRGNAVYVLVEDDQSATGRDHRVTSHQPDADQSALVEALQEQVGYLRGQLEAEREARRRADHIIAALTERIPELEAPPQSAQEAESVAEGVSEDDGREEVAEEHVEPESDPQPRRRSWWRRLLGG